MFSQPPSDLTLLLETKEEYTRQFVNITRPVFIQGVSSIYKSVREKNKQPKMILREFQTALSLVPNWSQTILQVETERFRSVTKCEWIDDLMNAIFVANVQILSHIANRDQNEKLSIEIPTLDAFLHRCYISLARNLWKNPILLYHKVSKADIQKNAVELDNLVAISIVETFRQSLPYKELLGTFLGRNGYHGDKATLRKAIDTFDAINQEEEVAILSQSPSRRESIEDIPVQKEEPNPIEKELSLNEFEDEPESEKEPESESDSESESEPEEEVIEQPDLSLELEEHQTPLSLPLSLTIDTPVCQSNSEDSDLEEAVNTIDFEADNRKEEVENKVVEEPQPELVQIDTVEEPQPELVQIDTVDDTVEPHSELVQNVVEDLESEDELSERSETHFEREECEDISSLSSPPVTVQEDENEEKNEEKNEDTTFQQLKKIIVNTKPDKNSNKIKKYLGVAGLSISDLRNNPSKYKKLLLEQALRRR